MFTTLYRISKKRAFSQVIKNYFSIKKNHLFPYAFYAFSRG